ncbi:MAG: SDR family oxidoreductase [Hyphomicrobiaceae bacterium]|nr:MAG: SDR family oxidoreductase [Hyphomicrobiaceae bacterium]
MATLQGKHALVTGAGSGIGTAIARTLSTAGAAVSLVGRRARPLRDLAAGLGSATAIVADVTSEEQTQHMVAAAHEAHGPIDIVIANAGAAESAPFSKVDLAHWQRMIDVNLTGAFLTARAALPDLTRKAAGTAGRRIVFIASTAGLKGYRYVAPYCAAKHGLVGLARALAAELAPQGIAVNAVCPGFTDTPLLHASLDNIARTTGRSHTQAEADIKRLNPQGRFVRPEEVAETVLWLCTAGAQAITGQAISVSGGEV